MTFDAFISANGKTIPPEFVYLDSAIRGKLCPITADPLTGKDAVNGGPGNGKCFVSKKDWMINKVFMDVLRHFQHHTHSNPENKVLLLMNNHASHCHIDALMFAKANGIEFLTFWPHLTNRIQPLNVCLCGMTIK